MTSGDGWTTCARGHRHWGLYGAAGLLITDGANVVLQHRAPWTHEGDTWGVLGGARNSDEDAVTAALREANEEADLVADDVLPVGLYDDDHGGWSYTTVVARPVGTVRPHAANAESVSVRWHPIEDVAALPLHTGFAAAWHHLRALPAQLYLVVGGEAGADARLDMLRRNGIETARLPSGIEAGGLNRLLPAIFVCPDLSSTADTASALSHVGQVVVAVDRADLDLLT
jgi:8-oxo-dGTP pyrophosphatase MutT (NUDIX family)